MRSVQKEDKANLPTVAFVIDDRVPREKAQRPFRLANELRHFAQIETIEGEISESDLINKGRANKYALVIVPWYRYLQYKHLEGELGLTRTSGPTVIGYFPEGVDIHELAEGCGFSRAILLDFHRMADSELVRIVCSVLYEAARSGLRALFRPDVSLFEETWSSEHELASRAQLFSMISQSDRLDWRHRTAGIRICLMALWSLFYEDGPGKPSTLRRADSESMKAVLQFAQDQSIFALRLVHYYPNYTSHQAIQEFWYDRVQAHSNQQLLLRYSDLLRIHTCPETHQIEYTLLFTRSQPSVSAPNEAHSLWIEPLNKKLFVPASDPLAKPLPDLAPTGQTRALAPAEQQLRSKERLLNDALLKVRELTQALHTREQMLREMRVGGVGTGVSFERPDIRSLLMAFQERYKEAQTEIHELEHQISALGGTGAQAKDRTRLKEKLDKLLMQEQDWIRMISLILNRFKKDRMAG
jgi:hypothetical protein